MRTGMAMLVLMLAASVAAQPDSQNDTPRVAIVIDDLGDRWYDGQRSIQLNGDITIGIIPYTPYARKLAVLARKANKEILLHLPMEAMSDRYLGRGGLHSAMSQNEFLATLQKSLRFIPDIRGVSNHMGSRLTQNRERMSWLMAGLKQNGNLYFLDSRTIDTSLALKVAAQTGLEHATRDVFLDHNPKPEIMQKQWRYFLQLAKQKGSAVCIAHPYPDSLAFLEEKLATLDEAGVTLVSVSELIHWRNNRGEPSWQTSMSSSR